MSRHFKQAQGLAEYHDPATHEFVFNQTMFRIKDPDGYWIKIFTPDRLNIAGG
jgi:hypothetical protein